LPKTFKGKSGMGSVWTWGTLDADSKLIISSLPPTDDCVMPKPQIFNPPA